jgi:hypothetical protein
VRTLHCHPFHISILQWTPRHPFSIYWSDPTFDQGTQLPLLSYTNYLSTQIQIEWNGVPGICSATFLCVGMLSCPDHLRSTRLEVWFTKTPHCFLILTIATKNLGFCHVQFDMCTDTVHVSNSLPRALCHACKMWMSLTVHFDTCIKYTCPIILTRVFQYTCQTFYFFLKKISNCIFNLVLIIVF